MSSIKHFATQVELNETDSDSCHGKDQLMKVLLALAVVSLQQTLGESNCYASAPKRSCFEAHLAKAREKCSNKSDFLFISE